MTLQTTLDLSDVVSTTLSHVEPSTAISTEIGVVSTLLTSNKTNTVSTIINIGLPGEQGATGASGGEVLSRVSGEALSGHMFVSLGADNKIQKSTCMSAISANSLIGITLSSSLYGEEAQVQPLGPITNSGWNFTPNNPVFLGENGQPVQTLPVGAVVSKVVGFAANNTTILLGSYPAIIL
jgi:hypothetical protein